MSEIWKPINDFPKMENDTCEWKKRNTYLYPGSTEILWSDYLTSCEKKIEIEEEQDENSFKVTEYKFCPNCGKRIEYKGCE